MRNRISVSSITLPVCFAVLSAAFLTASCSDDLTNEQIDSQMLRFEVTQNGTWSAPQSSTTKSSTRNGRQQTSVQRLQGGNETDRFFLHTQITNGINTDTGKGDAVTRATPIESADNMNDFQVYGYMKNADATSGAELYMKDIFLRSGTGVDAVWDSGKDYFWPGSNFSMRFFAYAPTEVGTGFTPPVFPATTFTYEVPTAIAAQQDLMVATTRGALNDGYVAGDHKQDINLAFNHILTAVNFKVGKIRGGTIHSVSIKNVHNRGTFDMDFTPVDGTAWGWNQYAGKSDFSVSELDLNLGDAPQTGTTIASGDLTFMMIPQTLPDDAVIEVIFTPSYYKDPKPQLTLTAPIGGTVWETGKTVTYNISIGPQYEAVDLGLSVKWATFNVGAYVPEEPGDYYYWGATKPYNSGEEGSSGISETDILKYDKGEYNDEEEHIIILPSEKDVATQDWGTDWRMPTKTECQELLDWCTWEKKTAENSGYGIDGYLVTSNIVNYTDKYIFLPLVDNKYRPRPMLYWASTYDGGYTFMGDSNILDNSTAGVYSIWDSEMWHSPIRPVQDKN